MFLKFIQKNNLVAILLTLLLATLFLGQFIPQTAGADQHLVDVDSGFNKTTEILSEKAPDGGGMTAGAGSAGQTLGLSGWRLSVYSTFTVIGAMIAWIGGFLLDVSLSVFVANMAGAAQTMGLTSVIVSLWQVIRDFFNLLFIFSLIWVGFQTILGTAGTDTKKWVSSLVVAALLINFSLYITQVVVDFSNVAAFQVSQMMQTETYLVPVFGVEIQDISGGFTAKTQLENFPAESQEALNNLIGPGSGFKGFTAAIAMGFVAMMMLIVLGFVFAAGALIMFTRFIGLTFLMVFSPFIFLGWVFPKLDKFGKQWQGYFISQVLVGPVFLFMLYFSYRALEGFSTLQEYTLTNVLVYFVIVIGFVSMSLVVAKKIGAYGASQAINIGKGAANGARSFATNTGLYIPRALTRWGVGGVSNIAQDKFTAWQAKKTGGFARSAVAFTNLDNSIIGATEAGKKAKFGLSASYKDVEDRNKNRRIRITGQQAAMDRTAKIDSAISAIENNTNNSPLSNDVMKDFASSIKDLTDSQLTEHIKLETLTKESVAIHLSGKQIETLEKSGKYSDKQISEIKKARSNGLENVARGGLDKNGAALPNQPFYQARTPEWISQKGVDEIAKMPVAVFTAPAMAPHLTPAMVEAKMKSGLSQSELVDIRSNINNAIFLDQANNRSNTPGQPNGSGYTKQWATWSNRNTFGAKLGLNV